MERFERRERMEKIFMQTKIKLRLLKFSIITIKFSFFECPILLIMESFCCKQSSEVTFSDWLALQEKNSFYSVF